MNFKRHKELVKVLSFLWLATVVVFPLSISTTNFKSDFSGEAADTSHLKTTWGNTLDVAIEKYELLPTLAAVRLNNAIGINGQSAANPVVVNSEGRVFKIAYTSWNSIHQADGSATPANVVIRTIIMDTDTTILSDTALLIAQLENPSDMPPPSYLNFAAEGTGFAAYWSMLTPRGYLRRSSDNDMVGKSNPMTFGEFVPKGNPEQLTDYYGTLGMAGVPASNADRLILAYDYKIGTAEIRIRWEDLSTGSSQIVSLSRPVGIAEDFAVAADASGNAFIMWREDAELWGTAYNALQAQIMAPTLLVTEDIYIETVTQGHTYRKYGAAALAVNQFAFVYGKMGTIYYNSVNTSTGNVGSEERLTPTTGQCYFPDVAVSSKYVVFSWYGNMHGGTREIECAWFQRSGTTITATSRKDLYLSGENVAFNAGASWKFWHNYHVPNVALDDAGDVVVAYDNSFDAKTIAWLNTPMYFSNAFFTSDSLRLGNTSIAYHLDPTVDSISITDITLTPNDQGSVEVALSNNGSFSSFISVTDTGTLASPLKGNYSQIKYRVNLETSSLLNQASPRVSGFAINYNVKPHAPTIDTLQLGASGAVQLYTPGNDYNLVARQDVLRVIAWAFDADNQGGLSFLVSDSLAFDNAPQHFGSGYFRSMLSIPPLDRAKKDHSVEVQVTDAQGWNSNTTVVEINYFNYPPSLSASLQTNIYPHSEENNTVPLYENLRLSLWARDTTMLNFSFSDGNDSVATVRVFMGTENIFDTTVATGENQQIPLFASAADTNVIHRIQIADPDTTIEFLFFADYHNDVPLMTAQYVRNKGEDVDGIYIPHSGKKDTILISADTLFPLHERDTAWVRLALFDSIDLTPGITIFKDSKVVLDTQGVVGEFLEFPLLSGSAEDTSEIVIRINDPDTASSLRFFLLSNKTPTFISLTSIASNGVLDSLSDFSNDSAITVFPLREDTL
ncbi:MAG: hypothetical protein HQK83_19750, partial [Fibrobacteria bacterium]|nr:hypothetical protein [Fibrobacteria bacterium]